jgi:hypothetical protein
MWGFRLACVHDKDGKRKRYTYVASSSSPSLSPSFNAAVRVLLELLFQVSFG